MNPFLLLIPIGLILLASGESGSSSKKKALPPQPVPTPTPGTQPAPTPGTQPLPQIPPGANLNPTVEVDFGPFGNVAGVQQGLIDLGYNLGSTGADGDAGPRTNKAVLLFQRMAQDLFDLGPFELRQDGEIDTTTVGFLTSATIEAQGGNWPSPEEWLTGATADVPPPSGTGPGATNAGAEQSGLAQVEQDNADIVLDEWFVKMNQSDLYEIFLCNGIVKEPEMITVDTTLTGGVPFKVTRARDDISQWLTNVAYWGTYVGFEGNCLDENAPADFALPFSAAWTGQAAYRDAWTRIYEYIKGQMAANGWADDKLPVPSS